MANKETAQRKLLAAGVRITRLRLIVLELALETKGLFSAYDLRDRLNAGERSRIDLSTIYRALDLFEVKGLLVRTGLDKERRLYRVGQRESEALLTCFVECRDCGRIESVPLSANALSIEMRWLEARGFSNVIARVEFSANCFGCDARDTSVSR